MEHSTSLKSTITGRFPFVCFVYFVVPLFDSLVRGAQFGVGRGPGTFYRRAWPMARITDMDRFVFERELLAAGVRPMAGVDEAGRGPLAGPVVAAAVILPETWIRTGLPAGLRGLNDSKQLSEARREAFFAFLTTSRDVVCAVAVEEADTIDRINILQATHRAMARSLQDLPTPARHFLVDGRPVPTLGPAQTALVKGDSRSYSIAAASVLAKVTRDRLMLDYHRQWPDYGFAEHKGYGTRQHLDAIARLGPCPIHRRSFAPLRATQPDLFAPSI